MTDQRDPRIRGLIVELAESSPAAPSFTEIELLREAETGPDSPKPLELHQKKRRIVPGWVYGIAAIVAVLLLIGGVAWLFRGVEEAPVVTEPSPPTTLVTPDETVVTEPSPPTTVVTPDETQAMTWDSFRFNPDRHPILETIVATDNGLIALGRDNDLLTSDDGVSWVARPLGFPLVGPVSLEKDSSGGFWLTDGGVQTSAVMWRSDDGAVWTEVDTSAIRPPGLSGVDWTMLPGSFFGAADWPRSVVISSGETALTTWRFTGFVPWVDILGIELSEGFGFDSQWDAESQTLELFDKERPVGRVNLSVVAEQPLTIEARDDSGTLVHTITGDVGGLTTDEMLEAVARSGFEVERLYISENGRPFQEVPAPWAGESASLVRQPFVERDTNVVASEGRFIAYRTVIKNPDTEAGEDESDLSASVEAWVSNDGRDWSLAGTPTFSRDQVVGAMTAVLEREGVLLVGVWGMERGQELWRSEDGLEWKRVASVDGGSVSVSESFWVLSTEIDPPDGDGEHFVLTLSVSSDGETWREVSIDLAEGLSDPAGGYDAVAVGDLIFVVDGFVVTDPPQESTMWVGRFDE